MAAAVLLAGCRVDTDVAVDDSGGSSGRVSVTVTLDKPAVDALGGVGALRSDLRTADLVRAGWSVAPVRADAGGGAVVLATHSFSSTTEADRLLSSLAGPGPGGTRPFALEIERHRGWWQDRTALVGRIDLRCGLACFGDESLTALTGSPTGFDPAPLMTAAGVSPAQVFRWSVEARLPGRLTATGVAARQGSTVVWHPVLGQSLIVDADSRSLDTWRIGGTVGALSLLAFCPGGYLLWRSRRRRGRHFAANRRPRRRRA